MLQDLFKVYRGAAIDVAMLKKFLEKHNIKSYADNGSADNDSQYTEKGFDPNVDLKVAAADVEKSLKLIDEFINSK